MEKIKWWAYPLSVICFFGVLIGCPLLMSLLFSFWDSSTPSMFEANPWIMKLIISGASTYFACKALLSITKGKANKFVCAFLLIVSISAVVLSIMNYVDGLASIFDMLVQLIAVVVMVTVAIDAAKGQIHV